MKHERTKATEIPKKVKEEVWKRDDCRCIYCKRWLPMVFANSHFIKRSQGGLGIVWNIVTACPECHDRYDTYEHKRMFEYTKKYLISKHEQEGWDINKLVFEKNKKEEEI